MADRGGVDKGRRILVPLGGNAVDAETVRLAARMAAAREGQIYAIHVIEVARSLPLGASLDREVGRAEAILDEAEQLAGEADVGIETQLLQARDTGPAIVGEAESWEASWIVMGLPYKRRFGDFNLGRTVPFVLKQAPCRVILFRERLG
jgi:nucleotide-binding universal stress UspA family protein